jgi:hypothetical protein
MEQKTLLAKQSISKRWEHTNVLPSNNERNTSVIRNDTIKGKEKKEKNNTISPNGVKQPQLLIDSKGNPQLDHNGNPIRSLKGMVF